MLENVEMFLRGCVYALSNNCASALTIPKQTDLESTPYDAKIFNISIT